MTEAVSFQIIAEGQEELDHFWSKLTEGISEEDKKKQMCGWLRDRFGVSWQVCFCATTPPLLSCLVKLDLLLMDGGIGAPWG